MNPWFWHLLAYPLYQIVSTFRHEGSHAAEVWFHGGVVVQFKILPHFYRGDFYWGRVRWITPFSAAYALAILRAPYAVNAASIAWGFVLARAIAVGLVQMNHWTRFGLIMLLVSPAIDTLYNAGKWLFRGTGDFARMGEYQ